MYVSQYYQSSSLESVDSGWVLRCLCWVPHKKIYTSPVLSFWDCHPLSIRPMRRNHCHSSRNLRTSEWLRWKAIWGESKLKWSQQCSCGFLQCLLIKAAGISSWLTSFRYGSQVLQSFFFFSFFSFSTYAKYQSLENTGKLVCFLVCSFLIFLLQMCFSGCTFLRHFFAVGYRNECFPVTTFSQECH